MSCIHYKFSSKRVLVYNTVTFNGLHISLGDLKRQIMAREKLKAANCDLQITNAQSKEEYADENALIPKNLSVIVRRIPPGGVKATSKTYAGSRTEPASGTSKATASLAEAVASEEEKIKAMMIESCRAYDPINYVKKTSGPPPPACISFRCGRPGHYIKNCPTNGVKNFEPVPRMKKSTGIPRSFLMEVKDPKTKGAMLTNTGKYVIPIINAEAYARGKKEKPPFLPEEPSSSSSNDDAVPDVLLCLICKELMTDAAVIPCCGNSYCDECIRTALLESEEHTCPTCHQTDVSPDSLVANKFLRQAVNNFINGTGYTKRLHKQIQQQQQLPPPRPPAPLMTVTPPAALVTAAELPKPGLRRPASPSLLGPQGQSTPTTGHPKRASTVRSAGGRAGWELSKSPCSASSYSSSLCTYAKSRSCSSHTCCYSPSFPHSHSRSCSRSPPYPRRGKGKSRNCHSRSRPHESRRARSRSPPCRRHHSQSRSPVFRRQSPTKQPVPQGQGERMYFSRYREVPPRDRKAYYGSSYARQCREDYPRWQSHQNHNTAGNYPSVRESHGIKDATKSKEKKVENPLGEGKGNQHKKHWKRRKGEENEGFPNAEFLKGARKPREPVSAADVKADSLFMLQSRDGATPGKDEQMEADSIAFKAVSEKEKKEKNEPKAKIDKSKRKVEVAVPPKKDNIINPAKASQEKEDTDHKKSPQMEPPVKKVKEQ